MTLDLNIWLFALVFVPTMLFFCAFSLVLPVLEILLDIKFLRYSMSTSQLYVASWWFNGPIRGGFRILTIGLFVCIAVFIGGMTDSVSQSSLMSIHVTRYIAGPMMLILVVSCFLSCILWLIFSLVSMILKLKFKFLVMKKTFFADK